MIDSIMIQCNVCGHDKVLNQSEIFKIDLIVKQGTNKSELSAANKTFYCSKCRSKDIKILKNSEVVTDRIEEKPSNQTGLIKSPYDSLLYRTGSLCPNFTAHKDIKKHRGKRKANDFYENRRSY